MHSYRTEQFIPINLMEAWRFFSTPKNLSKITPPSMDFRILTQLTDDEVYEGMKIEYTVKPIFGIRVHWQTEIAKVKNPLLFMDRQLKGPYKVWEHTHSFSEVKGGVLMKDVVNYELPLGVLGKFAHALFVKRKIESIFSYRREVLNDLFVRNGKNVA